MKNYKLIMLLLALVLILLSSGATFALQKAAFLNIPQGAREISMGETGVSHSRSSSSIWWNPAHINGDKTDIWFQSYRWFGDGKGLYGGFNLNNTGFGLTMFWINNSMDGFEVRNIPGPSEGEFSINDLVFGFGTGFNPSKNISLGLVYKGAFDNIYGDRENNLNILDLGVTWDLCWLNFGLAVRNLQLENPWKEQNPTVIQSGITRRIGSDEVSLLTTGELVFDNSDTFRFHLGAELGWMDQYFVRTGYMAGHSNKDLSFGIGANLSRFDIDFALVPFEELGTTWRMGLGITL